MDEYAYLCPVCDGVRSVGTCPTCPDVLTLKVKKTWHETLKRYYWRLLS